LTRYVPRNARGVRVSDGVQVRAYQPRAAPPSARDVVAELQRAARTELVDRNRNADVRMAPPAAPPAVDDLFAHYPQFSNPDQAAAAERRWVWHHEEL